MLAILHPNTDENSDDYRTTFQFLEELQDIQLQTHVVQGEQQKLTEIYLVGDTKKLNIEDIASLPAVEKVIRISHEFRILGNMRLKVLRWILNTTGSGSTRTVSICLPGCAL